MAGLFSDYIERQTSPDPAAQSNAPQTTSAPSPSYPGLEATPPSRPYVFYSGPNPPAAPSPPSVGAGGIPQGFANGLTSGINNHPLTLMALGAGIAQGGVGRGLELATAAAQAERNLQAQQVNHARVFNALTGAGVPADEALAAVMNPSLMRALAVKYLGPRSGGKNAGATPSATSSPAANQNNATQNAPLATASASAPASAPAFPAGVPNGSFYSRSRNLWEDPDGNLFDLQGRPVK